MRNIYHVLLQNISHMWNIDSLWFEVAVVSTITAVGSIYFGHFEEHTPRWRRVIKLLFFILLTTALSATVGRTWSFSFLGAMLLIVVYVHAIWLPRKGINGLTGEPRDKYYELRGWKKKDK
jgi:uncharacterized membrane protein YfcA